MDESRTDDSRNKATAGTSSSPSGLRGFLSKYPIVLVLACAVVGVAVGIGLSTWDSESEAKDNTLKWIGLLGDLYLRSLKAIVLPLIFVSVVLAVMEMMTVGRASSVGWKTVVLYLTTTLVASVIAVIAIVAFKGLFKKGVVAEVEAVRVTLGCMNQVRYLPNYLHLWLISVCIVLHLQFGKPDVCEHGYHSASHAAPTISIFVQTLQC